LEETKETSKEIIEFLQEEMAKKDKEIASLKAEIASLKTQSSKNEYTSATGRIKEIPISQKSRIRKIPTFK
jgi:chromosome segregation ATPase